MALPIDRPDRRVVLRDVTTDDLPVLYEQQADPVATRMAAFAARDRDSFTAHWRRILADGTATVRAVVVDGRVAGNILCFEQSGQRLVGYWLGREYWGRGIATRALSAFLDHVAVRPLHARVATHNLASIRVLEKCGFRLAGREPGPPGPDGEEIEDLVFVLRAPAAGVAADGGGA